MSKLSLDQILAELEKDRADGTLEKKVLGLTAEEKLDKLYSIRKRLHPLCMVLVVGFKEVQKGILKPHDREFIHTVYPEYFR